MGSIVNIAASEQLHVDGRRIRDLVAEYGEEGAKSYIVNKLESLAALVLAAEQAMLKPDREQTVGYADELALLSWQAGLSTLQTVATDIGRCAKTNDALALRAVMERLKRVFDECQWAFARIHPDPDGNTCAGKDR